MKLTEIQGPALGIEIQTLDPRPAQGRCSQNAHVSIYIMVMREFYTVAIEREKGFGMKVEDSGGKERQFFALIVMFLIIIQAKSDLL